MTEDFPHEQSVPSETEVLVTAVQAGHSQSDERRSHLVEVLRRRATGQRRAARRFVVGIYLTGGLLLGVFVGANQIADVLPPRSIVSLVRSIAVGQSIPVPILKDAPADYDADEESAPAAADASADAKLRPAASLMMLTASEAGVGRGARSPDFESFIQNYSLPNELVRYVKLSTISIRLGTLTLCSFLIGVFHSYCRYHTRAGAHYDAIADALELTRDGIPLSLSLMRTISPGQVDVTMAPNLGSSAANDASTKTPQEDSSARSFFSSAAAVSVITVLGILLAVVLSVMVSGLAMF